MGGVNDFARSEHVGPLGRKNRFEVGLICFPDAGQKGVAYGTAGEAEIREACCFRLVDQYYGCSGIVGMQRKQVPGRASDTENRDDCWKDLSEE
jgi:hypothetical protein